MARPLLSAALIVRDESLVLSRCLRSLHGLADEIVVVDTGSKDNSRDIARDCGARVLDYPWNSDFAAARNAALDAASGQWALYIDADEEVVGFERAELAALLGDALHAACTVRLRPVTGYTRYREHRLFRNRADLRFRGVIHESILPALGDLCAREGLRVADSSLDIHHYGYDRDSTRKHERNLPLLRARLEAEPGHIYSWWHLGATLQALGDVDGAEHAWRQAVEILRTRPAATLGDSLPYLDLARQLLDQKRDATALLDEACARFPNNHALAWLRARDLVEGERYEDAMLLFARLAEIDAETLCDGLAYDPSIFGVNAHAALGLCAFRLGRFGESAAHYARAEALAPNDLAIRRKRQLAQAQAALPRSTVTEQDRG
ncbi:MAG TPA: glycosyltransferase [Casimicrobiaceae bacterium]|nr:glycosyltransferase [Casimicrobiaceae bacterium]